VRSLPVLVAFLWGWSEATWFFLIPDVWLTFTIFWGPRKVAESIGAAIAGACLGAVTYYWLPEPARQSLFYWWTITPGYAPSMFQDIRDYLRQGGWGFVWGPWEGIPYRYYLHESLAGGLSLGQVLLYTPLARSYRFILVPLIASAVLGLVRLVGRRKWPERKILVPFFICPGPTIYCP